MHLQHQPAKASGGRTAGQPLDTFACFVSATHLCLLRNNQRSFSNDQVIATADEITTNSYLLESRRVRNRGKIRLAQGASRNLNWLYWIWDRGRISSTALAGPLSPTSSCSGSVSRGTPRLVNRIDSIRTAQSTPSDILRRPHQPSPHRHPAIPCPSLPISARPRRARQDGRQQHFPTWYCLLKASRV